MSDTDNNEYPQPPKWLHRFVTWYCLQTYQDEVLGDLYEIFDRKVTENGLITARWWFFWNTLFFIRLYNLKIIQNNIQYLIPSVMWKNYLKISLRHAKKNAPFIAINVVGLGLALACCIFAYVLVEYNQEFNLLFRNTDDVYQIYTKRSKEEGKVEIMADRSPFPLGQRAVNELAGVQGFTQYYFTWLSCSNGKETYSQQVSFTPNFDFTTYPKLSNNLSN